MKLNSILAICPVFVKNGDWRNLILNIFFYALQTIIRRVKNGQKVRFY